MPPRPAASPGAIVFTFRPVNAKEYDDLGDFAATYRSTLELRVASERRLPETASLEAYTDSVWEAIAFEVVGPGAGSAVEAFNGIVRGIEPLPGGGLRARALRAATKAWRSFDETIYTVRGRDEAFRFAASDLLRCNRIVLADLGVLIRLAGDPTSYEEAERSVRESPEKDIYTRVSAMPEQTLARAWADVPEKEPQYIPLGFEGGRQHFGVDAQGEVFCDKNWISRIRGRDTPRALWEGDIIRYSFGLPRSRPVARGIADGCLPILSATWEDGGVRYRQTAFVMPLAGIPAAGGRILADDPLVLIARIEMEGIGAGGEARLAIGVSHGGGAEAIALDGDRILAAGPDPPRMRMLLAGDRAGLAPADGRIALRVRLAPGAARLREEAEAYRRDILASALEAMRRSPVVRLRDGSWIPHIPSDVHRRGRSFGWIAETLQGAIHMVRCELIDPKSRLATWILRDFEDNLYISSPLR